MYSVGGKRKNRIEKMALEEKSERGGVIIIKVKPESLRVIKVKSDRGKKVRVDGFRW